MSGAVVELGGSVRIAERLRLRHKLLIRCIEFWETGTLVRRKETGFRGLKSIIQHSSESGLLAYDRPVAVRATMYSSP